MESANKVSTILGKKIDAYQFDSNDYIAEGEITVTITLNEYRDLIESRATKQEKINAANKDKYEREAENKELREENASLKAELYELKKRLDEATGEEAPEKEDV